MKQARLNIAIDGNEANVSKRVGSNVYAFEILKALEKRTKSQSEMYHVTVLLHSQPNDDLPKPREGWIYQVFGPKQLWTQWALPKHLYAQKKTYGVFFTPSHYAPSICPIPYVSSVMDLAFLSHPHTFRWRDLFQLKHWTEHSAKNANRVIAISQATKTAIHQYYQIKKNEIVVAYPGSPPPHTVSQSDQKQLLQSEQIQAPFFLFVGTIQPRKNIPLLVAGYEQFITKFQTEHLPKGINPTKIPQLILAGKTGWMAQESLGSIRRSSVSALIKRVGFSSLDLQTTLYSQAQATLLVSDAEGFGLPPLEAMRYGSLPIVVNSSSLPEVVDKAGLIIPPNSPEAIADALWQCITLSAKQKAMYRKFAREQLAFFSWEASAQIILETLQKVAKK
ncbi:glycosyltransferase family 4 protein [Candidatus Woesebacteria bacterium]|nr:glycosyltransferase family 4 protein [Candidatus Woesebacteria bacterium]